MSCDLTCWANIAQIASLPLAVIGIILTLLTWAARPPNRESWATVLKFVRKLSPFLAVAGLFLFIGLKLGTAVISRSVETFPKSGILLERYDFEDKLRLIGTDEYWHVAKSRVLTDTIGVSSSRAREGTQSLVLRTFLAPGTTTGVETRWAGIPPRGTWVAYVFVPERDLLDETWLWARLYTRPPAPINWDGGQPKRITPGWNRIEWDTRGVKWKPTDSQFTVGIEIGAEGKHVYDGEFYIDDVEVHVSSTEVE